MPDSLIMRWILGIAAAVGIAGAIFGAVTVGGIALRHTESLVAYDSTPGPQVVIGIDLSEGSPLTGDPGFARQAGERIGTIVDALPMRALVSVRTFGDYGASPGPLHFDRVVSMRQPADTVAGLVRTVVSGVPGAIAQGRMRRHERSNILAFLEGMSTAIDCARATRVILISDGLEDSEYAVLGAGNTALPVPEEPIFEGCAELQIVGLGHGQTSPTLARQLRDSWSSWASAAGFGRFVGLETW